jgi:Uncharacterized protein conserved in bacteria
MADESYRLVGVSLEERDGDGHSHAIEREREIALFDLVECNLFKPLLSPGGPYKLVLGIEENRLVFNIKLADGTQHGTFILSLTPLRKVIKDYFAICDSYTEAVANLPPSRIEAIDMARRGLHNEGAFILQERLASKICIDSDTARRLFTLICVLHLKG